MDGRRLFNGQRCTTGQRQTSSHPNMRTKIRVSRKNVLRKRCTMCIAPASRLQGPRHAYHAKDSRLNGYVAPGVLTTPGPNLKDFLCACSVCSTAAGLWRFVLRLIVIDCGWNVQRSTILLEEACGHHHCGQKLSCSLWAAATRHRVTASPPSGGDFRDCNKGPGAASMKTLSFLNIYRGSSSAGVAKSSTCVEERGTRIRDAVILNFEICRVTPRVEYVLNAWLLNNDESGLIS